MRVIVTGGAGFIGSAYCRYLISSTNWSVINLDKLTYAASPEALTSIASDKRYRFVQGDIADAGLVRALFKEVLPDAVINLAAESHVDRSIDCPGDFIHTNIHGTFALLEEARRYYVDLPVGRRQTFRFHHVSTDEVFGFLEGTHRFNENSPYNPTSPYAASKAAADHLVRAWGRTYGLPILITNCANNYGPYQFPEKLIPLVILRSLQGKSLPLYGEGNQVRDWLHVDDHAAALLAVLRNAEPGSTYHIGCSAERSNIQIVEAICDLVDELLGQLPSGPRRGLIEFVEDRPGHDQRYAVDASRIRKDLHWEPMYDLVSGLRRTVQWYLENENWWHPIVARFDALSRRGLMRTA